MWIVRMNQFLFCDRYFYHTWESWFSQAQNKYFLLITKWVGRDYSTHFQFQRAQLPEVVNLKTCTCDWLLPNLSVCVCSTGCLQCPSWHIPKSQASWDGRNDSHYCLSWALLAAPASDSQDVLKLCFVSGLSRMLRVLHPPSTVGSMSASLWRAAKL